VNRVALRLAVAIASAGLLTGCGGATTVSSDALAQAVTSALRSGGYADYIDGSYADDGPVQCGVVPQFSTGAKTTCHTGTAVWTITFQDSKGTFLADHVNTINGQDESASGRA
jgi:hypothetical protein